jgi:DMSO/TMAO reductase YedYZ molybdopterin-dependent catalytic subunit
MTALSEISAPSRLAGPEEGISEEELQLAARNHGFLSEAMRFDVTPVGLHYLLIHYDIPDVSPDSFALAIGGAVSAPLRLSLDDLRKRPRVTSRVTMECAGNGRARLSPRPVSQPWLVDAVGTADWAGTPLAPLLREAGLSADTVDIVFTGADHGVERGIEQDYQRSLTVDQAMADEVLLAYEMNGSPLPPQHGFPLRLVVPGWYGMAHVKWLTDITASTAAFTGFQQVTAYMMRQRPDETGVPITRIEPRALLIPPGFPDFMSRSRVMRPGPCLISGRAWSGHAPIVSVEVTTDGGETWQQAPLSGADTQPGWEWRRFDFEWDAKPGRHRLSARASDGAGNTQPVEPRWNRGGFANNLVQQIDVLVIND